MTGRTDTRKSVEMMARDARLYDHGRLGPLISDMLLRLLARAEAAEAQNATLLAQSGAADRAGRELRVALGDLVATSAWIESCAAPGSAFKSIMGRARALLAAPAESGEGRKT